MLGFGILIIGIRRQILQHFCNWTWVASVTFIVELRNRNTAPDLNSKPSVINFLVFGYKPQPVLLIIYYQRSTVRVAPSVDSTMATTVNLAKGQQPCMCLQSI